MEGPSGCACGGVNSIEEPPDCFGRRSSLSSLLEVWLLLWESLAAPDGVLELEGRF